MRLSARHGDRFPVSFCFFPAEILSPERRLANSEAPFVHLRETYIQSGRTKRSLCLSFSLRDVSEVNSGFLTVTRVEAFRSGRTCERSLAVGQVCQSERSALIPPGFTKTQLATWKIITLHSPDSTEANRS